MRAALIQAPTVRRRCSTSVSPRRTSDRVSPVMARLSRHPQQRPLIRCSPQQGDRMPSSTFRSMCRCGCEGRFDIAAAKPSASASVPEKAGVGERDSFPDEARLATNAPTTPASTTIARIAHERARDGSVRLDPGRRDFIGFIVSLPAGARVGRRDPVHWDLPARFRAPRGSVAAHGRNEPARRRDRRSSVSGVPRRARVELPVGAGRGPSGNGRCCRSRAVGMPWPRTGRRERPQPLSLVAGRRRPGRPHMPAAHRPPAPPTSPRSRWAAALRDEEREQAGPPRRLHARATTAAGRRASSR